MSNLPTFNFGHINLDDGAFNQLVEQRDEGSEKKKEFFKPGKHEVRILSSKATGTSEADPTWLKFRVEFEGTYGKKVSDLILVPTKDIVFNTREGKQSKFPIKKLKTFLEAIGVQFALSSLTSTLSTYFGKDDALAGLNVAIETAYQGPHLRYDGKSDTGDSVYSVVNRRGEALLEAEYVGYKAAEEAAKEAGIEIKKFVDVENYLPSSTPNNLKDANW